MEKWDLWYNWPRKEKIDTCPIIFVIKKYTLWIDAAKKIWENYEQHFINKCENLDGMDNFLEKSSV